MDSFRDFASELEPAFGSHAADMPEVMDDAEERRMQVKAYNYWTSLLGGRDFPSIEDLEPASIAEFAKHSVLIDFTTGPASATTAYVGVALRRECDLDPDSDRLAEAPAGSLLSRLATYYAQILDSRAPVGFETEFRNQRGEGHSYRGILMPFSSDGDTIDFVYGVFNWSECEVAEEAPVGGGLEAAHDEDDALELSAEVAPAPVAGLDHLLGRPAYAEEAHEEDVDAFDEQTLELAEEIDTPEDVLELSAEPADYDPFAALAPVFPHQADDDATPDVDTAHDEPAAVAEPEPTSFEVPFASADDDHEDEDSVSPALPVASITGYYAVQQPQAESEPAEFAAEHDEPAAKPEPFEPEVPFQPEAEQVDDQHDAPVVAEAPIAPVDAVEESTEVADDHSEDASLDEWLTAARATAEDAKAADGRSRQALYRALAQAYDFACAAVSAPAEYQRLLDESAITVQARAPMTAVAKLVFGADQDKARLTEYAAALSFAARQGVETGEFLTFIEAQEGGLKALVEAERRLRRPGGEPNNHWRDKVVGRLRSAEAQPLDRLAGNGEFALVLVRRDESGAVSPVAAVTDEALLERAMKKAAY